MSFHIENELDYNPCYIGINGNLTEAEHDDLIEHLSKVKLENLILFVVYNEYEVEGIHIFDYAKLYFTPEQKSKFRNYLIAELKNLNSLIDDI